MKLFFAALLATLGLTLASSYHHHRCPKYKVEIVRATAHNARGLKHSVDRFRKLLGGDNNVNEKGPLKEGRREINWDGGAPFILPNDFFNRVVPRGAIFFTKFDLFAQSNPVDEPPFDDDKFSSLNKDASKEFVAFSEKRLFTPLLDNKMTTKFFVPGTKIPATVSGFGAVYTGVDKAHTSFLTLYDRYGCVIKKIAVPPKSYGLSFVGAVVKSVSTDHHSGHYAHHTHDSYNAQYNNGKYYNKAVVYKVKLTLGNTPIIDKYAKSYGKHKDVVVTDDFIYGEPQKL